MEEAGKGDDQDHRAPLLQQQRDGRRRREASLSPRVLSLDRALDGSKLASDGEGAWMLLGEGEEEDEAEGAEEADDLLLDEHAMSLPLVQPARLNLYTPQINLESLTAGCSKGVLVLIYLLFGLCIGLTIGGVVMGNTDVPFEPVHCGAAAARNAVGRAGAVNSSARCTPVGGGADGAVEWWGNVSGVVNLIGTISLSASLLGPASGCLLANASLPPSLTYDTHVWGCTLADPRACFSASPTQQAGDGPWQDVLWLSGRRWTVAWPSSDGGAGPAASSSVEFPVFSGIFQNQEVLRNFGSISAYQMQVVLSSESSVSLLGPSCPLSLRFSYTHVYPILAFRVLETLMLAVNLVALAAWAAWLYYRLPRSKSSKSSSSRGRAGPAILERHWLTLFLAGLLCYQDPVYCFGQWAHGPISTQAKFISQVCVCVGQSVFFTVWLLFVDGFRRRWPQPCCCWFVLPKLGVGLLLLAGSLGMAALSFPSLSPLPSRSPLLAVNNWDDGVRRGFLAFSLLFSAAFLLWACAFATLMVLAAVELRRMNYLQTRYLQLSYRFFFLQAVLVAAAYAIIYVVAVVRDVVTDSSGQRFDQNSFINHINTLLVPQTQPFGKLLFLFVYGFLLLYLHLPASPSPTTGIITTYYLTYEHEYEQLRAQFLAITSRRKKKRKGSSKSKRRRRKRTSAKDSSSRHVQTTEDSRRGAVVAGGEQDEDEEEQRPGQQQEEEAGPMAAVAGRRVAALFELLLKRPLREVRRRLLPHQSLLPPIFCVETAAKLLQVANQAYYDVTGQVTPGGWGELDVGQFGYEVVDVVWDGGLFDTFALVLRHRKDGRIVVAFRGSSSKKQWLNNLRFQQCELDFSKLPELALADHSPASPTLGLGSGGGAAPVKQHPQHEQAGLMLSRGGSSVEEEDVVVEEEQAGGAMGRALHPGRLAEAVATGAELIQQTGEMVVDGVLGAAQLLGVDRLPGIRRLLRGHVHQGFWEAYLPVRSRLSLAVYGALLQHPGSSSSVWVTGHSLGGALATFAALDLAINTLPRADLEAFKRHQQQQQHKARGAVQRTQVALYNFGSPRVMNHALASRFNRHVPHCFRVVADGDIVTHSPPSWYYKHVGTEVVVDGQGSGSLVIDPSFMERRLRTRTRSRLREHMLSSYERALVGALEAGRALATGLEQWQDQLLPPTPRHQSLLPSLLTPLALSPVGSSSSSSSGGGSVDDTGRESVGSVLSSHSSSPAIMLLRGQGPDREEGSDNNNHEPSD